MIHVSLISHDCRYMEASCLRDVLQKIERLAGSGKRFEDKKKGIRLAVWYRRPCRRKGDILGMDELAARVRGMIVQVRRLPDSHHHALPPVMKIAVHVDIGIAKQFRF